MRYLVVVLLLLALTAAVPAQRLRNGGEHVDVLQFSPDGQLIAAAWRGGISVWDLSGRSRCRVALPTNSYVQAMTFSRDGTAIGVCTVDMRVYALRDGHEMTRVDTPGPGIFEDLLVDGDRSLSLPGDRTGEVSLWRNGYYVMHSIDATSATNGARNRAVWSSRRELSVYDASRDQLQTWLLTPDEGPDVTPPPNDLGANLPPSLARQVALSEDGKRAAVMCRDRRLMVWDVQHERLLWQQTLGFVPTQVAFAGDLLAVRSMDGAIAVDDASTGRPVQTLQAALHASLYPLANGLLAVRDADGITVWAPRTATVVTRFPGNVNGVAVSPVAPLLAVSHTDGSVELLPVPSP